MRLVPAFNLVRVSPEYVKIRERSTPPIYMYIGIVFLIKNIKLHVTLIILEPNISYSLKDDLQAFILGHYVKVRKIITMNF